MAKTLFNTSENSNFILNLTEEKYSKMASVSLILPCILISLATIPCEFNIEEISYPIISGAMAICGVICMIMSIIAFIKGYVSKKKLIPVLSFGAMILWGVISLINSYDKAVSFYGFDGRGEGLLAIIFYFCFFVTASAISLDKFKTRVFDAVVISGAINSFWAILQLFAIVPNTYDYVSSDNVNAVSGLSQSPIFLAMILCIALVTAIIGGICFENKKRRIIYTVCAVIFSFVIMFTYTLVGIVSLVLGLISGIVTIVVKKSDKKNFVKILGMTFASICAVLLVNSGAVSESGADYSLHDGSIMWFDSFNRLGSSGNYNPELFDVNSTSDVYSYLTSETLDIIKENPLVGTGIENLVYPQLHSSLKIIENNGTFDKNYNEYLYIMATRGIPSFIAYLAIIVSVLCIGVKRLKTEKGDIYTYLSLCAVICGSVIFIIGAGNIAFSSIFWIFVGFLSCSTNNQ